MAEQYIDSQEHWEDEINADYDQREMEAQYIEKQMNEQIQRQIMEAQEISDKRLFDFYSIEFGQHLIYKKQECQFIHYSNTLKSYCTIDINGMWIEVLTKDLINNDKYN